MDYCGWSGSENWITAGDGRTGTGKELVARALHHLDRGSQVLNPDDLTRTPGGSSGGTGASIAAHVAVIGTGSVRPFDHGRLRGRFPGS